jgi:hypothetical protein
VTGIIKQLDTSDLFSQWNEAYARMFSDFEQYMSETKAAFNSWFATLTDQLTVECGFIKLENYRILPISPYSEFTLDIGIDQYDPSTDALMVFFDGRFWMEGQDYIQEYDSMFGNMIRYIGPAFIATKVTRVNFVVFKNIIGKGVIYTSNASVAADGININNIGIADYQEV